MFFCEFYEISKNTYSTEHIRTTASVWCFSVIAVMRLKLLKEMLECLIKCWMGSANEKYSHPAFIQLNPKMLDEMVDSFCWALTLFLIVLWRLEESISVLLRKEHPDVAVSNDPLKIMTPPVIMYREICTLPHLQEIITHMKK